MTYLRVLRGEKFFKVFEYLNTLSRYILFRIRAS
mgnify:FL=1